MIDREKLEQMEILFKGLVENLEYWRQQPVVDMVAYRQALQEVKQARKMLRDLRKESLCRR